jgi:hypothetical protein
MLSFKITLNRHGAPRLITESPAIECGLIGCYSNGKPYQPDSDFVFEALPYQYRKAFLRASKWWQEKSMTSRALPLKTDLKSLDGKPMGTIWATPNWIN